MKKILIAVLFATTAISVFAQSRMGVHIQPQFSAGVGATAGDFYGNDYYGTLVKPGADKAFYSPGVHIGYMFSEHAGLYTGVNYSSFGWSYEQHYYSTNAIMATSQVTNNYIQVPIYIRLITSQPGKVGLFLTSGVNIGILTAAHEKHQDNSTGETQLSNDKSSYHTAMIATSLAVGINIPCNEQLSIDLGVSGQYSSLPFIKQINQNIFGGGFIVAVDFKL